MSFEEKLKSKISEMKSFFKAKAESTMAYPLKRYPREVLPYRRQVVEWMIYICQNCRFSNDTLFRCMSIFDVYMSKVKSEVFTIYEVNLTAIASLSLATKVEEVNCNYVPFFTKNVLNTPSEQLYTESDLVGKEIQILKVLGFKTLFASAFDFASIFVEMVNFASNDCNIAYVNDVNSKVLKEYLKQNQYIAMSPLSVAIEIFQFIIAQTEKFVNLSLITNIYNFVTSGINAKCKLQKFGFTNFYKSKSNTLKF